MTLKRACTLMTVKSVNEDERVITGIASTPSPDRDGDILEPEGASYRSDTPFLWQHDRSQPIGTCTPKMVKEGIQITAKLVKPTPDMPSQLAARLDEAWASIKAGLVRGLSIGFRPIEYSFLDEGGIRFLSWDLLEVSAVTIPANAECNITTVKSFDRQLLAASGNEKPVVIATPSAGATAKKSTEIKGKNMNIAEQIKSFEAIPGSKTVSTLVEDMVTNGGKTIFTVSEPLDWSFSNPRVLIRYQDGSASGLLLTTKVGDFELSVPEQPEFVSIIMDDGAIEPPRLIFCDSSRVGYNGIIAEIAPQSDGTCQVTAKEYKDSFYQYDNAIYPGNIS